MEDYAALLKLCAEAEKFVAKVSTVKARANNLAQLSGLVTRYVSSNIYTHPAIFVDPSYSVAEFSSITAIGDNLSAYDNEKVVDSGDIEQMINKIDSLTDFIRNCDVNNMFKDRMIVILGEMRIAINRINTIGPNDVIDGLDKMLGVSVRAALVEDVDSREGGKGLLAKSVELAQALQKFVETGEKVYPVISTAIMFVKNVLGFGDDD